MSNDGLLLCVWTAEKKFKQWLIVRQNDKVLLKHQFPQQGRKPWVQNMQGKNLIYWEFDYLVCKVQSPWSSKALKPMLFFKLMNSLDPVRALTLLTYLPGYLEDVDCISLHHAGLSPNLMNTLSSLTLLLFLWRKCFNVAQSCWHSLCSEEFLLNKRNPSMDT